ncbi:NAD(P)-dependent oxidoreductase [Marinobacterium arenosum]|uniref:NAD(P)-dependent oxidoreductase n=1 Tax=Marinobacterium arenosum TaxID=2862496 RepID=UPI001C949BA1|nr:NAD(P)-dependent oxidoreductase [Marinobacterium arenosum]MBY4677190.1 NAD(P)-dependent oxidoreductase [Marinobacterium arenosum]
MAPLKIAFLGIGLMGRPMALHLLNAGFRLTAWNRTRSKAEVLIDAGATVTDSPAEAVQGSDVVICMLENGPVVEQVLFEQAAVAQIPAGALLIDMGSSPPEMAKRHATLFAERGIGYLDAPVSGGTVGAEQANLSIMAGGSEADFRRAEAIFAPLGRPFHIGPAGSGQLAKCANQAVVGITIGAVAEALLLAAEGGANPEAVREALLGGFAGSRILELHGQRMLERDFQPGATARVQLKDLRTILDTAREQHLTLPLTQRVHDEYLALVNGGNENCDHSGLLLQLEALNRCQLGEGPTQAPPLVATKVQEAH